MDTTPSDVIKTVILTVCGCDVKQLERLTAGGMNETYRVELTRGVPVIVRIARQMEPWFTHEQHNIELARTVGVPAPDVLGVEQIQHEEELLSFSVLQLVPGRSLEEIASDLPKAECQRLIMDSGELLARLHSVSTQRGMQHQLKQLDEKFVTRVVDVADRAFGPDL